jgi:hypothetical protein
MDCWSAFAASQLRRDRLRETNLLACLDEARLKGERSLVRKRGFEPPRGCPRQPLKLVRLPFRHFRVDSVRSNDLPSLVANGE